MNEEKKLTIAIAGTGEGIKSGIADRLATTNVKLLLCDETDIKKAEHLGDEIVQKNASADVEVMDCLKKTTRAADIIILAMPHKRQRAVAEIIREAARNKIVISLSMPKLPSFQGVLQNMNSGVALQMQELLPESRIVAALNSSASDVIGKQINRPVEIFLAGNDGEAVESVSDLIKKAGLIPVKTGRLSPLSIFNEDKFHKA
ncbi:NAD(P)-binding domain-containing protein [Gracilimonas mengyeensis]|uniref:Pyrroline-5-carboxylate reductase catalytic N-terminal domain-containing protein n=1 Tax=Gracilimonas mengyeensis TaxID=1302730 RepID=A0A521AFB0_9BACT|nr:NAD(P)-binding domain-containing protein [Gracilimonas mengyeensis]SMO33462.1 hypothetical protein SAMN06265219_101100 [Gracilimonas mengyeensis]